MLKIRVMPTLLYRNSTLVKGQRFDSWRTVGGAMQSVKVYNMREVDELVFFDIAATSQGRGPDCELIDDIADECFMPMTVGGGITCFEQARQLLRVGADKVAVNSGAVERPEIVSEIANAFGSQCCTVSIDVRRHADRRYQVYTHSGAKAVNLDPVTLARRVEADGAGEIILCNIDRDGTMEGYDLDLIRDVSTAVSIPIIASGGAGSFQDLADAIAAGASAVAASSLFQFTEKTPLEAKRYLREAGLPVRL